MPFETLKGWLANDAPVKHEWEDAFGHARIARRVAARLAAEEPPAQAIVGALRSGKTTVRNLVQAVLKRRGGLAARIRVVQVELWPYETTSAAAEGLIGGRPRW